MPTADLSITPIQLHILRHSIGLDDNGNGREYRNHYAADPNPDLIALRDAGYMTDRGAVEMWGGLHCFIVTESGKQFVRGQKPAPVKLSRSKSRYQNFLRADCGLSFGEWLKMGGAA